jgi:hypothetical protein
MASATAASSQARLLSAPCGLTYRTSVPASRAMAMRAPVWAAVKRVISAGV